MNQFIESLHWLDRKHEVAYSMIRIFLGVALFVGGWILISDPEAITRIVTGDNMHGWSSYITIAHLVGGLLIAIRALTRLGVWFQVSILFSAVVFVPAEKGLMMGGQSLELATLVLFLLAIFALFGGGIYSIDRYFLLRKLRKAQPAAN